MDASYRAKLTRDLLQPAPVTKTFSYLQPSVCYAQSIKFVFKAVCWDFHAPHGIDQVILPHSLLLLLQHLPELP